MKVGVTCWAFCAVMLNLNSAKTVRCIYENAADIQALRSFGSDSVRMREKALTMDVIYIMRVLWRNYNSSWENGMAFFDKEKCHEAARQSLKVNYLESINKYGLHDAEMVFKEDRFSIGVYARRVGKEDEWVGTAEIREVPISSDETVD